VFGKAVLRLGVLHAATNVRVGLVVILGAMVVAACARSTGVNAPSSSLNLPRAGSNAAYSPPAPSPARTASAGASRYKVGSPYRIGMIWYVPREEPGYDRSGTASWYGADFHGRATANGERYDMNALTAAHPTLPLPSYVTVTNLANNRTVLVRVNDRGPYVGGRILDLSRAAARALDYETMGTTQVRVRYAGRAPLDGNDARERQFLSSQPWFGTPALAQAARPRAKTPPSWFAPWGLLGSP
jgi:rare lipoprotein A